MGCRTNARDIPVVWSAFRFARTQPMRRYSISATRESSYAYGPAAIGAPFCVGSKGIVDADFKVRGGKKGARGQRSIDPFKTLCIQCG